MTAHSKIVGGSTASRVINCPGSVALCDKVPPQVENDYMREGTMLHDLISQIVFEEAETREEVLNKADLTDDQRAKIETALRLFDTEVDPEFYLTGAVEATVAYPWNASIFGTADVIGKVKEKDYHRAIVLDWKFGDGVMVDAKENEQLLFYAAAAWASDHWAFKGIKYVELIIIQPPFIRRWMTDIDRLAKFNDELAMAVHRAQQPDAPIVAGDHCRFCPAKAVCPVVTGAVERAVRQRILDIKPERLGEMMALAQSCEDWASDVRKLALQALEKNIPVPGYKLVNKRAQRVWSDEKAALEQLYTLAPDLQFLEIISPAQAEKALKTKKLKLPDGMTVAVSSGLTIAEEADSRPAAVTIGTTLVSALSKIV